MKIKYCIKCNYDLVFKDFLCEKCFDLPRTKKIKNKIKQLHGIERTRLKRFSKQLKKTPPPYQEEAFKITQKVCGYFGYKILKECVVKPYILDMYIPIMQAAIEIDGSAHDKQISYDDRRGSFLFSEKGIRVVRFTNDQVKNGEFEQIIWGILNKYYTETRYSIILQRAKENNIDIAWVSK